MDKNERKILSLRLASLTNKEWWEKYKIPFEVVVAAGAGDIKEIVTISNFLTTISYSLDQDSRYEGNDRDKRNQPARHGQIPKSEINKVAMFLLRTCLYRGILTPEELVKLIDRQLKTMTHSKSIQKAKEYKKDKLIFDIAHYRIKHPEATPPEIIKALEIKRRADVNENWDETTRVMETFTYINKRLTAKQNNSST